MRQMRSTARQTLIITLVTLFWSLGGPSIAQPDRGGRLRGEVANAQRLAVPGATVIAATSDGEPVLALTSTNERGLLALDDLPGGVYDVHVDAEGYLRQTVRELPVRAPYRAVADFELETGYASADPIRLPEASGALEIELRVVGDAGQPIPAARLRFDPVEQRANPVETATDEDGVARLEGLRPGLWRLTLTRAGWARLRVTRLALDAGAVRILARMEPLPARARVPIDELMPKPRLEASR